MSESKQGGVQMPPPPAPAADSKKIVDPVVDPSTEQPKRELSADQIVLAQEAARIAEEAAQKKAAAKPERMKGYWVEALGPGVYNRSRYTAGHKFIIDKWEDLGSWMKCVNPVLEEKHQREEIEKKKKLNAAKK